MDYKKITREIIEAFFVVYTVAFIINGIFLYLPGVETIKVTLIFDMMLISIATSLPTIVVYSRRELKRRELIFRIFIQFVLTLSSALAVATYMRWIAWSVPTSVFGFSITVVLVFITAHGIFFFETKKLADKLNEKLKERYKK